MSQSRLTYDQVQSILNAVQFMDRKFILLTKGDGYLIQMSYLEADVENPEKGLCLQKTRKWYCSPYSTETEIVETCWAMVCRSALHVASEHFNYKGRRVYSQHFDVNTRLDMCDKYKMDGRE